MQHVGIATFLMLLWKDTYGPETILPDPAPIAAPNIPSAQVPSPPDAEPWRHWPRPPGGFIDLGCGNRLLTHILISEGYAGYRFDLRVRTSWTHYPQATQSCVP
jgi:tRNASer (uridine44-2'-O)-methyltransferase